MSDIEKTALVLIGFQNDYMDPDGILQEAIED
ncbi:MAG TPA: isochorismatase, partial [Planctomycetes bacterium]|nr:isochorismatase [Planctomycetota bacterium]HIO65477.1 isochorismatase [Planctomycetota bacterium]